MNLKNRRLKMKIAFFDIDGTLIDVANNLAKPTARTLSALKEF